MKEHVYFFSENESIAKEEVLQKIGIRGRGAMELAALGLPILPGFVIDSDITSDLSQWELEPQLRGFFKKLENVTGKRFGDPDNPLLVKIVLSPSLVITTYPTLHNYGLTDGTLPGFIKFVGENFARHEQQFLCRGSLEIEARIAELEKKDKELARIKAAIIILDKDLAGSGGPKERAKSVADLLPLLPKGFASGSAYQQLELALKRISRLLALDEMNNQDTSLIIQPMVYGNYGKDSASGNFFTRNIVTGERRLQGDVYQEAFDSIGASGQDINSIAPAYLSRLEKISRTVEDHFREIRSIRFTIENKKLWLIDQQAVMSVRSRKSAPAGPAAARSWTKASWRPSSAAVERDPAPDHQPASSSSRTCREGSPEPRARPSAGFSSAPKACSTPSRRRSRRARTPAWSCAWRPPSPRT
jgi:pyruvate,orthophosphate dikinase